jgi:hypothetical protein
MESSYCYQPLPTFESIRIFTLYPGNLADALEGNISVISLSDQKTSFKALSYTWGNPLDKSI